MKCYLLALTLLCVAYETLGIDSQVNKQACIRDAAVNPALVDKAYNGDVSDDRELKCYFKCYFENAGYMNSKGEIQADKLKANIPTGVTKTTAERAVELCKDRKGKDACETAYLLQKCLLNNNVKY